MRTNNRNLHGLMAIVVCAFAINNCAETMIAQETEQRKFPYQALVLNNGATTHSGPGQGHYATEKLRQGAVVEVYREDPGGWCAIRPTEGSFSLVPEATLEVIDDAIGRISQSGTQAWVGTKLGPVEKPLWQVKLKKGEEVEVLGQVSWPDPEGHSTVWYQISPPAGEFRWIKISDIQLPATASPRVSTVSPQEPEETLASNPSQMVRSLSETVSTSPALDFNTTAIQKQASPTVPHNHVQQATLQTEQLETPVAANQADVNRGWRQATRPIASNGSDAGFTNRGPSGGGSYQDEFRARENFNQPGNLPNNGFGVNNADETIRIASADMLESNMARGLDAVRMPNSLSATTGSRTLSPKMSDLELQLTREMIKPDPSSWRLEDLEIAATAVYRASQNMTERLLAERYLAKITQCKTIRSGYRVDTNPGLVTQRSTKPIGSGISSEMEFGTTYDAHGWLTELVRDGGRSPSEYALQDSNGKLTHHIAPAPGMNLRRYLKSRVGVIGQRGYHNKLKMDHVTAHRIIELQKPEETIRR